MFTHHKQQLEAELAAARACCEAANRRADKAEVKVIMVQGDLEETRALLALCEDQLAAYRQAEIALLNPEVP